MKRLLIVFLALVTETALAYPLDGQERTGIRRLQHSSAQLPAGARLNQDAVRPSGIDASRLPAADEAASRAITAMLGDEAPEYGVAILDISDPSRPLYAHHQGDYLANVGSVGKVLVMMGWFQRLADRYPDDTAARERLLRETVIAADDYIVKDNHEVPIVEPDGTLLRRPLRIGDRGNLWEYLDWAMSASSNAAATVLMKELVLAQHLGDSYPLPQAQADPLLTAMKPSTRGSLLLDAMLPPLSRAGFDLNRMRQGSLFTGNGKVRIPGTSSSATPRDLVRLLALIEANRFVDPWSSQEAKRLLYMTARRIRYASHPVLNSSAVYFKSGSLYSCVPEPGFRCRKYMGNKINRLASIAMVESPAHEPRLRYLVAVMSNILRKNSAVAHQTLALRIHRLVEQRHHDKLQGQVVGDDRLPAATIEDAEGSGRP